MEEDQEKKTCSDVLLKVRPFKEEDLKELGSMKVPFVGEITGVLEDNWTAGGTWTLERIDGDCRELDAH